MEETIDIYYKKGNLKTYSVRCTKCGIDMIRNSPQKKDTTCFDCRMKRNKKRSLKNFKLKNSN